MGKKTVRNTVQNPALEFLGRGDKVPKAFLERRIAAVERQLAARARDRQIHEKYERYSSQIRKAAEGGRDPRETRTIEGILDIHKKLAKRTIAAATPRAGLGGVVTVHFEEVVTPPYDYAFTISKVYVGNPTLSSSADKAPGQLASSVVTESKVRSYATVSDNLSKLLQPPLEFQNHGIRGNMGRSCTEFRCRNGPHFVHSQD